MLSLESCADPKGEGWCTWSNVICQGLTSLLWMSAIKPALWKMGTFHILKCLDWNVHMMKKISLATSKSSCCKKAAGIPSEAFHELQENPVPVFFPLFVIHSFIVLTQLRVWPQASLVAQLVKNLPAVQETWVWSLGWEDPLEKERLPTLVFWPGEFHGLYSPWEYTGERQVDWSREGEMTFWMKNEVSVKHRSRAAGIGRSAPSSSGQSWRYSPAPGMPSTEAGFAIVLLQKL